MAVTQAELLHEISWQTKCHNSHGLDAFVSGRVCLPFRCAKVDLVHALVLAAGFIEIKRLYWSSVPLLLLNNAMASRREFPMLLLYFALQQ